MSFTLLQTSVRRWLPQVARGSRRAEWGFRDDDFVVLVWGRVRLTAELDLDTEGFRRRQSAVEAAAYVGELRPARFTMA